MSRKILFFLPRSAFPCSLQSYSELVQRAACRHSPKEFCWSLWCCILHRFLKCKLQNTLFHMYCISCSPKSSLMSNVWSHSNQNTDDNCVRKRMTPILSTRPLRKLKNYPTTMIASPPSRLSGLPILRHSAPFTMEGWRGRSLRSKKRDSNTTVNL